MDPSLLDVTPETIELHDEGFKGTISSQGGDIVWECLGDIDHVPDLMIVGPGTRPSVYLRTWYAGRPIIRVCVNCHALVVLSREALVPGQPAFDHLPGAVRNWTGHGAVCLCVPCWDDLDLVYAASGVVVEPHVARPTYRLVNPIRRRIRQTQGRALPTDLDPGSVIEAWDRMEAPFPLRIHEEIWPT